MAGGRALWNGHTVQECSDAIRWLTEATGGVLLMAQSGGQDSLAELEARVAALEAAGSGEPGVPQAEFDALVATVTDLQAQVTALDARVAALEAPVP